jgi:hypothetical protein
MSKPKVVSRADVATVLLCLEPAAHAIDGLEGDDPRIDSAQRFIDEAIFIIETLTGETHEALECDKAANERMRELLKT